MDINQLITEVRNGKPAAQREMFMKYSPQLYRVACRYASDSQRAEDILQESWLKIFGKINQYSERGKFEAWCKVIVVRTALSYRRKFKIHIKEEDYQFDDYSLDPKILSDMNTADLMKIIDSIPQNYADIFKLYVIDGYSHKEIGEMLGIGESTSRCKVSLARKKLRTLLSNSTHKAISI